MPRRAPIKVSPEVRDVAAVSQRAFSEGAPAKDEAERMFGHSVEMDDPLTLVERRAFMKLPRAERRRRLAEQAARIEEHYARDREWEELEAGDLVGE